MSEENVTERLFKISKEAQSLKGEAEWEIFLEEKINNDFFTAIQELLNLYDNEKLKNHFIISENINDIYEKALDKIISKHISNTLMEGAVPRKYLDELIKKYENEINNDGPLTKTNNYNTLRAVINDLEELTEPEGVC